MPPGTVPPGAGGGPKQFTDFVWIPSPDQTTIIVIAIVLLLVLAGFITFRILRERQRRSLVKVREIEEIRQVCHTKGLEERHADLLIKMAKLAEPEHPSRIVVSILAFDRCVDRWIASLPAYRRRRDDSEVQMLSQMRIRLGFYEAFAGKYLPTTRELNGGEQLLVKITDRDTGRFYRASIIDVDEVALTVSYLDDGGVPVQVFPGDELDIRFTRANDADYAFTSRIIERRSDLPTPGYDIEHATTLHRKVKRGDLRLRVKIPVRFYRIDMGQMEELRKQEEKARKWKPMAITPEAQPPPAPSVTEEIPATMFVESLEEGESDQDTGVETVATAGAGEGGAVPTDEASDEEGTVLTDRVLEEETTVPAEEVSQVESEVTIPSQPPLAIDSPGRAQRAPAALTLDSQSSATVSRNPLVGMRSARERRRRRRGRGIGGGDTEDILIEENLDGIEMRECQINNLSRGGVAMTLEYPLPPGEFIRFDPTYRGEFPVGGLIAQVIRSQAVKEDQYVINLKFVRISKAISEKIGKRVLQKDREESLKRAGLA